MGVRLQSTQDSDTALPSQSRLSPGHYIRMCYLLRRFSPDCGPHIPSHILCPSTTKYPGSQTPGTHRISRLTIADLNSELVRRRHDVPPHLRITNPLSPAGWPSLTSPSDMPFPQSLVRPCSVASPLSATEPSKAISGKSNIRYHLRRRPFPARPLLHGNFIWLLSQEIRETSDFLFRCT
jgi:hypothetical protein